MGKQTVKLRKIEAFSKQLVDEWISLDEDKKEEGFKCITTQLASRVPAEYLAMMAEQFAAATDAALASIHDDSGNGSAPAAPVATKKPEPVAAKPETKPAAPAGAGSVGLRPINAGLRPAAKQTAAGASAPATKQSAAGASAPAPKQSAAGASTPAAKQATTGAVASSDASAADGDLKSQATKMVTAFEKKTAEDWEGIWQPTLSWAEEPEAIEMVFEVSLHGGKAEHCISGLVELCRTKAIQKSNVEAALNSITERNEEFTDAKDNAWRLHTLFLLSTFPKTQSTPWGWDNGVTWGWNAWWSMCERVVKTMDKFRAFDIMLEMLQMMQAKAQCNICQLQVWKEQGRSARVRKALGGWGEMDDANCVETLKAYAVKL